MNSLLTTTASGPVARPVPGADRLRITALERALALTSFLHSFSGGYDNLTLQVASPVATDTEYRRVFNSPGAYS